MVQKNSIKNKIIIICGATATGKSDLAIECAKLLDTEIISADSMYIYKYLNIGTAKPTVKEMQGVKHHLIDVVNPSDTFSVSDYKRLATPIIDDLHSKNKIPIICGGTGFYINSLLYDLSYGNSCENLEIREKYKKLAEEKGNKAVFDDLIKYDPESAKKLHYNDVKRVIRALEIYFNGTKKSDIKDEFISKYNYEAYAIEYPREKLYDRINIRVDKMINLGLIDEVKRLKEMGINETHQCMQGIGYKEVLQYTNGAISLEEMSDLIKLNTRHYAKRQITFFKRLNNLTFLQPNDSLVLAKSIIKGTI